MGPGTTFLARCYGIARSLRMYYGEPGRVQRMARFYAQFIRPGDLCFDVGAHVGSRIGPWLRLGARIVAVEPQPTCVGILRRLYGRSPGVRIVAKALGAAPGQQTMFVSDRAPTVSTLSREWTATVRSAKRSFESVRWDRSLTVPVTTLDQLIEEFGDPTFCKIDVEGYELEVLRGLSQPLRALSFEYIPPVLSAALPCLERLEQLGDYEYNWSPGESMRFQLAEWVDAADILALLGTIPEDALPGDVYARRR